MANFKAFTEYDSHQVILTSDRLVFNSKSESVFIISNEHIAFSANKSVHFNIGPIESTNKEENYFIINSPKIQLGLKKPSYSLEPITKGDAMSLLMKDLIRALKTFSDAIVSANATGVGVSSIISLNVSADALSTKLELLSTQIDRIKSQTSYTT